MPLVCANVIAAVGCNTLSVVGKVGGGAFALALLTKFLAATTALLVAYLLSPGTAAKLEVDMPLITPATSLSLLSIDSLLDLVR